MKIQSGTASRPAAASAPAPVAPSAGTAGMRGSAAPRPPPQAAAPRQQPLPSEAVEQVARQINEFLKSSASNLQVSVDNESDEVIVRVVDTETQEVIRQIPSEEMRALSQSLDQMSGLLPSQQA